jgi:hypothetical protein
MPDFATRLAALGVSKVQLRRWVEAVTGETVAKSTTTRAGRNPWRDALLALAEKHPAVLAEIKEQGR